jgi:Polyketide cyclase / dehydrase and lipid transport
VAEMATISTVTRLSESAIINAAPEAIWKTLGDFAAITKWHPQVGDCVMEDGGPGD